MKVEKKSNSIIIIILIVIIIGLCSYIVYDKFLVSDIDNEIIKENNDEDASINNEKEVENNYEINDEKRYGVVELIEYMVDSKEVVSKSIDEDLYNGIANYDYSNKSSIIVKEGNKIYANARIENGKLVFKAFDMKNELMLDGLDNIISIGGAFGVQGPGEIFIYVLTSDGSVYNLYILNRRSNAEYFYRLEKLNVNNALSICSSDGHKLNGEAWRPTVFIKTNDGDILMNHVTGVEGLAKLVK